MASVEEMAGMARLLGLGSVLNICLLSIVIFFVRRLIVKVDKIDILEVQVKAMVHEMKDLGHLRERVAVIEALSRPPSKRKNGTLS